MSFKTVKIAAPAVFPVERDIHSSIWPASSDASVTALGSSLRFADQRAAKAAAEVRVLSLYENGRAMISN